MKLGVVLLCAESCTALGCHAACTVSPKLSSWSNPAWKQSSLTRALHTRPAWARRYIHTVWHRERESSLSTRAVKVYFYLFSSALSFFPVQSSPWHSCTSQSAMIWWFEEKKIRAYLKQELPGRCTDTGQSQRSSTRSKWEERCNDTSR